MTARPSLGDGPRETAALNAVTKTTSVCVVVSVEFRGEEPLTPCSQAPGNDGVPPPAGSERCRWSPCLSLIQLPGLAQAAEAGRRDTPDHTSCQTQIVLTDLPLC